MSVEEYPLKFTQWSNYVPSLVFKSRDEMNRFMTSVYYLVKEECRRKMLHGDMTLSRLMMYD